MEHLQYAAMVAHCITIGVVQHVPWKLVAAPLALVVGGVFMGARRIQKNK